MLNDVLITVCVLLLPLESVWHFKERTLYACVFNWGERHACLYASSFWRNEREWLMLRLPCGGRTISQRAPLPHCLKFCQGTHTLVEFYLSSSTNDWLTSGLLNFEHSRVEMVFVKNGIIWTGKHVMDKSWIGDLTQSVFTVKSLFRQCSRLATLWMNLVWNSSLCWICIAPYAWSHVRIFPFHHLPIQKQDKGNDT